MTKSTENVRQPTARAYYTGYDIIKPVILA